MSRFPSSSTVQWLYDLILAVDTWEHRGKRQQKCNYTSKWGSGASKTREGGWTWPPQISSYGLPSYGHVRTLQFVFCSRSQSRLFQTALVAYSGNMDVSEKAVFHHHFEISGWTILTPFLFVFVLLCLFVCFFWEGQDLIQSLETTH